MLGANKILTVSYGTFSCTLEGFDDPFSTMRGIAEYFRDLAADDRYFGAEPPTPDPEMLHRIAQREVTKRVEAQINDGGIVLRQSDQESTTGFGTETAAAGLSSAVPAAAALTPVGESVAEKLQRIRAAVARAESRAGDGFSEDEHQDVFARAVEPENYQGPEETIQAYASPELEPELDDEDMHAETSAPDTAFAPEVEMPEAEADATPEAEDDTSDLSSLIAGHFAEPEPEPEASEADMPAADLTSEDDAYIPLPDTDDMAYADETDDTGYFDNPLFSADEVDPEADSLSDDIDPLMLSETDDVEAEAESELLEDVLSDDQDEDDHASIMRSLLADDAEEDAVDLSEIADTAEDDSAEADDEIASLVSATMHDDVDAPDSDALAEAEPAVGSSDDADDMVALEEESAEADDHDNHADESMFGAHFESAFEDASVEAETAAEVDVAAEEISEDAAEDDSETLDVLAAALSGAAEEPEAEEVSEGETAEAEDENLVLTDADHVDDVTLYVEEDAVADEADVSEAEETVFETDAEPIENILADTTEEAVAEADDIDETLEIAEDAEDAAENIFAADDDLTDESIADAPQETATSEADLRRARLGSMRRSDYERASDDDLTTTLATTAPEDAEMADEVAAEFDQDETAPVEVDEIAADAEEEAPLVLEEPAEDVEDADLDAEAAIAAALADDTAPLVLEDPEQGFEEADEAELDADAALAAALADDAAPLVLEDPEEDIEGAEYAGLDAEAALAAALADDHDPLVLHDPAEDGMLSPEEEAELDQELAAVAAEIDGDDEKKEDRGPIDTFEADLKAALGDAFGTARDDDSDADESDDHAVEQPAARAGRDRGLRAAEPALTRLLEETNTRFEHDENSRRRSAIAHLKAAVAATKADVEAGSNGLLGDQPPSDIERFRDDLAKAVRPRRPMVARNDRGERPSPLVLVSEQRIDKEFDVSDTDAGPVQPRRLAGARASRDDDAADNIFREAETFADFAAEMEVSQLPDLLEAAAAYTAFVEGQPSFSRPQIMRQLAMVDTSGTYSREDGLRSFGLLLREGKIERLNRGEYTVSKSTRFNPERRQAG